MPPRIVIVVQGGVVQEVASDTTGVLIKLLDLDSIEEGDAPDQWRPPDVVIGDPHAFDRYPSGGSADGTNEGRKEVPAVPRGA